MGLEVYTILPGIYANEKEIVTKVHFIALFGIEAYPVEVEIKLPRGLSLFNIIGFPDVAVKEASAGSRMILLGALQEIQNFF